MFTLLLFSFTASIVCETEFSRRDIPQSLNDSAKWYHICLVEDMVPSRLKTDSSLLSTGNCWYCTNVHKCGKRC